MMVACLALLRPTHAITLAMEPWAIFQVSAMDFEEMVVTPPGD